MLCFRRSIIFAIIFSTFLSVLSDSESFAQTKLGPCAINQANLIYKGDEPPAPIELIPIIRTIHGVSAEMTILEPGHSEILDVVFNLPKNTASGQELNQIAKYLAGNFSAVEIFQKLKQHQNQHPESPISLKEIGPPVMREKTNTYCNYSGPNCWNATLLWFFPQTATRYTSPAEMESTLNSEFHLISRDDQIRYGDVITIRQSIFGNDLILHTAVYLGNGLVWHKGGARAKYPYVFSTLKNMFRDYEALMIRGGVYHETYRLNQR